MKTSDWWRSVSWSHLSCKLIIWSLGLCLTISDELFWTESILFRDLLMQKTFMKSVQCLSGYFSVGHERFPRNVQPKAIKIGESVGTINHHYWIWLFYDFLLYEKEGDFFQDKRIWPICHMKGEVLGVCSQLLKNIVIHYNKLYLKGYRYGGYFEA